MENKIPCNQYRIITEKNDLEKGIYFATHLHYNYLNKELEKGNSITFEVIVEVTGEKPFLHLSGWRPSDNYILDHKSLVDFTFGPQLITNEDLK